MSLDWSGRYRAELLSVSDVKVYSEERAKSYFLHYLQLSPSVVLTDFIKVQSRLDIMNSEDHRGSQLGAFIGDDREDSNSDGNAEGGRLFSQNSGSFTPRISQMYLTIYGDFSALHIGQMPLHFGLGAYHNSGQDAFSHWQDTRQLIDSEMHWSENWSFIPMIGRSAREWGQNGSYEIQSVILQLLYQ